jgi:hypothetical protein
MKRIIYISFILVGLTVVSCSKEQIQPVVNYNEDAPIWKSSNSSSNDTGSTSGDTGSITDPNNDKDENSRKKN